MSACRPGSREAVRKLHRLCSAGFRGSPGGEIRKSGFGGGCIMRLDKYLKVSRLIKRRTVANEACDGGRVMINDRVARASAEV